MLSREKTNYIKGLKIVFSDKKMVILVVVAFFSAIANLGAIFLPYFAKWNCIGVLPMDQITGFLNNLIYKLIHVEVNINLTNEGLLTPLLQIGSGISYMLSMAIIPPLLKKMSEKNTVDLDVSARRGGRYPDLYHRHVCHPV